MPTQPQLKRLFALARNAGISPDDLKAIVADRYGHASRRDLSDAEYEDLCVHLQDAAGSRSQASGRLRAGELANEMEILAFLQTEGLPWAKKGTPSLSSPTSGEKVWCPLSSPCPPCTELDFAHAVTILNDFRLYRSSYKRFSIRDARRCLATWGEYPLWVWRRAAEVWLSHYRTKNERYFAGILKHTLADARRAA